jgi:methionine-S-sulfoxide reductase
MKAFDDAALVISAHNDYGTGHQVRVLIFPAGQNVAVGFCRRMILEKETVMKNWETIWILAGAAMFSGIFLAAVVASPTLASAPRKATFAGGCFWCMEPPYDKLAGVISTTSGYTGGPEENPSYEDVARGRTGHREAVEVLFDPEKISYEKLLEVFWKNINPTQPNGQFVDIGPQYRSAVFYHDEAQRKAAAAFREKILQSGRFQGPIVTEILPAGPFYPAEEYHQDYYLKNPLQYKFYRTGSGRDRFLEKIWGEAAE